METRKSTASKADKKKNAVIEPFADIAEPIKAGKRSEKEASTPGSARIKSAKAVRKPVKRSTVTVHLDPFAEEVEKTAASSPSFEKVARAKKTPVKKVKTSQKSDVLSKELSSPEPIETVAEVSPAAVLLAEAKLPELERENRARLQMQTPTRLYFYWSVKDNPWARLKNVFGSDLGSYTLVHKLIDKKHGREEIHQTDAQGNYWFNVDPDGTYQAEVGFYAPNRPYFRILYSNVVETPRRGPSPRAASEAQWTVSSAKFAEVLDVAGFSRDAFDVAMAGDDQVSSDNASFDALETFTGRKISERRGISGDDIRYALTTIASGVEIGELRNKIGAALFDILSKLSDSMSAAGALGALKDHFEIDVDGLQDEEGSSAVYGASLVHFPQKVRTGAALPNNEPRYNPVSSHSIR